MKYMSSSKNSISNNGFVAKRMLEIEKSRISTETANQLKLNELNTYYTPEELLKTIHELMVICFV